MDCPAVRDAGVLRTSFATSRARDETTSSQRVSASARAPRSHATNRTGITRSHRRARPGHRCAKDALRHPQRAVNANSPVYRVLRACNVPMDPENGQTAETATRGAHFPYKAPEGAIVAKEQTAIAQLSIGSSAKLNWTEHNRR